MRKSDGSRRLCTIDYKALNKKAIKDKFPISMVDDLFDELFGASLI